ncbi:hypothetical protein L1987_74904 [Smallanthus sonchifolius]|uniref:Uncharacterized protein n=1 Tax=Smallanthus sonchifolius TaxID=185202 RepID=A0ACB9A377_9ASTR|nr:hypothetical protein L1987_74904 [Smallanthus sonchifolius]
MAELVAGAALGAAFGALLKVIVKGIEQTAGFKKELTHLEKTLKSVEPVFSDIRELNKVLDRPDDETIEFTYSKDQALPSAPRSSTEVQAYSARTATSSGGGFSGSCSVPGLPEFVIGLDRHLAELKDMLLKDATRVLVVSAPGCIFDNNILYVTISTQTSLESIAHDLFKHYGIPNRDFKSKEDTKNQIENLIKQKGSGKMLLVLDDVWSKSKYIVEDLKFEIPEFKILVTSRSLIRKFISTTYNLSLLNDDDAKILFCHSAFPCDGNPVGNLPNYLVKEMVEFCKGNPLALTVVGASLCGEPEVIWRSTLKKWSEGQSILESHEQLLLCLQTSIDALDELHENVKECFLDLGMFPEIRCVSFHTSHIRVN